MKAWLLVRKGLRLNQVLEKRMFLLLSCGILLGALFHQYLGGIKPFISWIFAYMTFGVALSCNLRDFKIVIEKPLLIIGVLMILYLIMPLIAKGLAVSLLPGKPLIQSGLILMTAVPIGLSSTIWIGITRGSLPLSLATVTINTILAPLIVPLIMSLGIGENVPVPAKDLIWGLIWMVLIPTIFGILLSEKSQGELYRRWRFFIGPSTKILFALVIAANLAAAWDSLDLISSSLPIIAFTTCLLSLSAYLVSFLITRITKMPAPLLNTFLFLVGIRNFTTGLVIALNYFPGLTAVPLVFAVLCQQPLAALSYKFLGKKEEPN